VNVIGQPQIAQPALLLHEQRFLTQAFRQLR
jgi:hypothetical protein